MSGAKLQMPELRNTNQRHVQLRDPVTARFCLDCFISADKCNGEDREQTTVKTFSVMNVTDKKKAELCFFLFPEIIQGFQFNSIQLYLDLTKS